MLENHLRYFGGAVTRTHLPTTTAGGGWQAWHLPCAPRRGTSRHALSPPIDGPVDGDYRALRRRTDARTERRRLRAVGARAGASRPPCPQRPGPAPRVRRVPAATR